jgi:hypothetical protein
MWLSLGRVHSPIGGIPSTLPPLPHNRHCFRIRFHCGGEGRGEGAGAIGVAPSPHPLPRNEFSGVVDVARGGEGAEYHQLANAPLGGSE